MENFWEIMKSCPLFLGVEEEDMEAMLACLGAKDCTASKGKIIFHEGDPAIYVGIVLSGAIRVIREDYYGNRSIVAHMGPGEVFGESFACAGVKSIPVSVIAETDCQYLLIDCKRITASCTNACAFHSRMIYNLLRLVANKNLVFNQKLEIISKRTTREKLMAYLMYQAKFQGKEEFKIPYDRQALADYLEVDRSGLSAEISKLRKEGKLFCEKNCFRLLRDSDQIL